MDEPWLGSLAGTKRQHPISQEAADESGPIDKKKKNSRSRSGCLTCRARKIKCDESPQSCLNCERVHTVCPGYGNTQIQRNEFNQRQGQSSDSVTEAGIKRSRSLVSCDSCRRAKTKCIRDGAACSRCLQKQIPCMFQVSNSDSPTPDESDVKDMAMVYPNYQEHSTNNESFNSQNTPVVNQCPDQVTSEGFSSSLVLSPVVADQTGVRKLNWTFTLSLPTNSISRAEQGSSPTRCPSDSELMDF